MSHFFTFATNENGIVADGYINDDLTKAMSTAFRFNSVFIYSHGWWNDATAAANSYNRFSIGFASKLLKDIELPGCLLAEIPAGSLSTGIQWPSTMSDSEGTLAQFMQPSSFFTMETRADDVGETGVNGLLMAILGQWSLTEHQGPLTINLLGHSFGTKVICSALQKLAVARKTNPHVCDNVKFNVVLLQAACDSNDLEAAELYSEVANGLPNLRVLASRSTLDSALGTYYPLAHALEFFKKTNRTAMGYAGPTSATEALFGGSDRIPVMAGADFCEYGAFTHKLVIADLTPLHGANPGRSEGSSGHHSDIYYDEIYSLIARFLY